MPLGQARADDRPDYRIQVQRAEQIAMWVRRRRREAALSLELIARDPGRAGLPTAASTRTGHSEDQAEREDRRQDASHRIPSLV
jgi:hypothetical protein